MTSAAKLFQETGKQLVRPQTQWSNYQEDPTGFITDVLGNQLTDDLVELCQSVVTNPITIARSSNAVGKSQPIDTPIPTPNGTRPLGDLRVGDQVFSGDGTPTTVIGVYPQGLQPTYRVTFTDGSSTLASADHLWAVTTSDKKHRGKGYQVLPTTALLGQLGHSLSIPVCKPLEYTERDLPIDPYVLGALLGDGCFRGRGIMFSSRDRALVEKVDRRCREFHGVKLVVHASGFDYRLVGVKYRQNEITTVLRELGLWGEYSHEKFIPDLYLRGSVEQRQALLAGLLDTDGYCSGTGTIIQFSTASETLAHQVQWLVQTLGGTAWWRKREKPMYIYNGERRTGRPSYTLTLRTPTFIPFTLERKARRRREHLRSRAHTCAPRVIQDIQLVGERESVCIAVDHPSKLYVTEDCIITHNTFTAARLAIWFYKVFPDSQVYTTAAPPFGNLRRLLWGEIGGAVRRHPNLFEKDEIHVLSIRGSPLHFVAGVAIPISGTPEQREAKFSGRHAPHIFFIVDEADAVPPEIFTGIESCMTGGHARLLCMFNPRAPTGPVHQMEREKRAHVVHLSALRHPNVLHGRDVIPGAVTRETVVRRINEWTIPVSHGERPLGGFDVPEFLVGAVALSSDGQSAYPPLPPGVRSIQVPAFRYMVEGEYPLEGETQLISQIWIERARQRWDEAIQRGEPQGRPILGFDVAEFGADDNALCYRYGGFVGRIDVWNGVDPHASGIRVSGAYDEAAAEVCYVDGTGVGAGVAPQMVRDAGCHAVSVKFANKPTESLEWGEFYQIRDQLYWQLREWLRVDPTAALPPDEILLEELRAPSYQKLRGKYIKISKKEELKEALGRSPDRMESLVLTFYPEGGGLPRGDIKASIEIPPSELRQHHRGSGRRR